MRLPVTLLLAAGVAGCSNQTGILLHIDGPTQPTSVQAGVTALELVSSHLTWCGRWVKDASASLTRIDVRGRDLAKSPYELLVKPSHFTDLNEQVDLTVLALDANSAVLGSAYFGVHKFRQRSVDKYRARISGFSRLAEPDRPSYVSADGCVCLPGQPWRGNGSTAGCDPDVVTSFDRLVDTATCELGPGKRELAGPVCDGQLYGDRETADRRLPCFAAPDGSCRVAGRTCHDDDGEAYHDECTPLTSADAQLLPSGVLCAAYLQCEQQPCGDVIGCFLAKLPPSTNLRCQLRVDATTPAGMPIKPCADGKWEASLDPLGLGGVALTGADCVSSVIEGTRQAPFTLGLVEQGQMGAQPIAKQCPPTLVVEHIDATSPAEVPDSKLLDVTIGDHVMRIQLTVVRGCTNEASLICQKG